VQQAALRVVNAQPFQYQRRGTGLALAVRMFNRVRSIFLFASCAALIAWSSLSLTAQLEAPKMCCGNDGDCGSVGHCCQPEVLGLPECDEMLKGVCRATCIVSGGNQ